MPPRGQPGRPPQLVTVLAEDGFNLQWPRPVVSWRQLYGVDGPAARPALSDAAIRAERLTPGEPFGLLGSSSLLWRDTAASPRPLLGGPRPVQHRRRGPVPLGAPGGRRRGLRGRRRLGRARPPPAPADRPHLSRQPPQVLRGRRRTDADPGRDPGAQARSAPHAPAGRLVRGRHQFPGPGPGRRLASPSRPSTAGAWCSTWPRPGTSCAPARRATTAAAATPTARSRSTSRPRRRPGPTTPSPTWPARRRFLFADPAPASRRCARSPAHQMTVEWTRDVEPILERRCASCHGGASPAAGLPLARATPQGRARRHLLARRLLPPRARHLRRALAGPS